MREDIRLGRIDEIPIGANWSVLFVFVLVVGELSELVLPGYYPGEAAWTYWIVGTVTTFFFFASLLAHEVAHAVVARHNGIGVHRITFWLFGGVSELEGEVLTPGADFRIAAVGPITSFVLAGVFAASGVSLRHWGLVSSAAGWLAWMNVLLGAFNMIPAAPLDGGRVLRAVLWNRHGERTRAAVISARVGQGFAYLLVTLGVLEFLTVSIAGLWFVFLGWFLLSAARAEENSATVGATLVGARVRDVMTPTPTTFSPSMTVAELLDTQLQRIHFSSFPLVGSSRELEGLATVGRIRRLPAHLRATTALIDVACPVAEVPVVGPDEPLTSLLERMHGAADGRALVMDETGRLVGIVSPRDVTRYLQLSLLRSTPPPPRKV